MDVRWKLITTRFFVNVSNSSGWKTNGNGTCRNSQSFWSVELKPHSKFSQHCTLKNYLKKCYLIIVSSKWLFKMCWVIHQTMTCWTSHRFCWGHLNSWDSSTATPWREFKTNVSLRYINTDQTQKSDKPVMMKNQ